MESTTRATGSPARASFSFAAVGFLALAASAAPAHAQTFTCGDEHQGTNDGCDCGCGAPDPDCGAPPVDVRLCEFSGCADGQVPSAADPSDCVQNVCGDGYRGNGEACDDGDTTDEGGCSADCDVVQPGFLCGDGATGCRRERCGDGDRTRTERCDDGNLDAGDGCSPECVDEIGFVCYEGMPCRPTFCGDLWAEFDYMTRSGETCDDGNQQAGDGCDNCEAEPGWFCNLWDGFCQQTECGNGFIEGDIYYGLGESCDDGNDDPNDGCDECVAAPGYICWSGPCHVVDCGDGFIDNDGINAFEQCDDGDDESNDGCSASCMLEAGFDCFSVPPGNPCIEVVCGDGVVSYDQFGIMEACDDGNERGGDGCSASCDFVEEGFICDMPGEPCREPVCGDGFVDRDPVWGTVLEGCDDGNTQSGDGCTSSCDVEEGFECLSEGEPCRELPEGWVCSLAFFDSGDGCDCGCGIPDPDCTSDFLSNCGFNHCFEEPQTALDPCDPSQCVTEAVADDARCPVSGEGEGEGGGNDDGDDDDIPEPIGCGAHTARSGADAIALLALWCAALRSLKRKAGPAHVRSSTRNG